MKFKIGDLVRDKVLLYDITYKFEIVMGNVNKKYIETLAFHISHYYWPESADSKNLIKYETILNE